MIVTNINLIAFDFGRAFHLLYRAATNSLAALAIATAQDAENKDNEREKEYTDQSRPPSS